MLSCLQSSPCSGQQWPSCCFYCRILQQRVSALGSCWSKRFHLGSDLTGGSSPGASPQLYQNWASFTPFKLKLLLSFHPVLLHFHHHWPLVRYKHFRSNPYDCLDLPPGHLKTSCHRCCCSLRSVWNPPRKYPDGWPGLWPGTDGRWVMPAAEAAQLFGF